MSKPRRRRRRGEWTPEQAVTFIVTLAATGSVTVAAHRAGMSRKSAYALKGRDPAFAGAWAAAMQAPRGNKVEEVHEPPVSCGHGNTSPSRMDRERAFVRLVAALRDPAPLAPCAPAQ
ncbi:MAG TPA: hypothetical protein VJ597_03105 [Sphingomicrobium sp.]|nr:hypothetical protein [Sphingomicrobium sp.]